MPSSRPTIRFNDIIYNADMIARHTDGLTKKQFLANADVYDATLLRLLRISEAARKLGARAKELAPDQPWPRIRDIGNYLRHEYDRVDRNRIWLIVTEELPELRTACQRAIRQIHRGLDHVPMKKPRKRATA